MNQKMNDKLSVPSPLRPLVGVDSPDFPVPFDDCDRTPPVTGLEVPHVDPPVTSTLGTADYSEARAKRTPFTPTEIQLAIHLREQGLSNLQVARRLGRSAEGVRFILEKWEPTAKLAKATLHKGAVELAERVIKDATVGESLEVLDRLDVLPKRDRGSDSRVQVVLGVNIDGLDGTKVAVIDGIAEEKE